MYVRMVIMVISRTSGRDCIPLAFHSQNVMFQSPKILKRKSLNQISHILSLSVPNNQLIATFDYLFDWIGEYSLFDCVDW